MRTENDLMNEYKKFFGEIIKEGFALTLMPKKIPYKRGKRSQNGQELEYNIRKFGKILNQEFLKHAYRRHGKRLQVMVAIESKRGAVDKHFHLAIKGDKDIDYERMERAVRRSLEVSNRFEIENPNFQKKVRGIYNMDEFRFCLKRCDEGWANYITKEVPNKDFESISFLE